MFLFGLAGGMHACRYHKKRIDFFQIQVDLFGAVEVCATGSLLGMGVTAWSSDGPTTSDCLVYHHVSYHDICNS